VVALESSLLHADITTAAATIVDTMSLTAPEHIGGRGVSNDHPVTAWGPPVG
jgi:hypothetical protein